MPKAIAWVLLVLEQFLDESSVGGCFGPAFLILPQRLQDTIVIVQAFVSICEIESYSGWFQISIWTSGDGPLASPY